MAKFKYIGAPHDIEFCTINEDQPEWLRDGREWSGPHLGIYYRYRLVFSTAAGPQYAGYAVCLDEAPEATENIPDEPTPDPVDECVAYATCEVFTVYLTSGQKCEWPQNKPEDLVASVSDGTLYVRGPRDIPPSIFAPGMWTHCGVRLVEQAT